MSDGARGVEQLAGLQANGRTKNTCKMGKVKNWNDLSSHLDSRDPGWLGRGASA